MALKIKILTQAEQQIIDPTGLARQFLRKFHDPHENGTPTPVFLGKYSRSEWLELYQSRIVPLHGTRHQTAVEFDQELIPKYGEQGKQMSFDVLQDSLRAYYEELDGVAVRRHEYLDAGLDFFLRVVHERVERFGYPYDTHVNLKATAASLPTMGKKNTWNAEFFDMRQWRHLYEDLPGCRHMRGAFRAIHQDPVSNVRYIEGSLHAVKRWLRQAIPEWFSSWLNPHLVLDPSITAHIRYPGMCGLGVDIKHCDQRFGKDLVENYVLPVYEALLSPGEFLHLQHYVTEMFDQPIFLGDSLWTGRHALLSGQAPTNDFETIWDIIHLISDLIANGIHPQDPHVSIYANGDDTLILHDKGTPDVMRKLYETHVTLGESQGCQYHPLGGKSKIFVQEAEYLRRKYYLGSPCVDSIMYGSYPGVLTMNSVVNPERRAESRLTEWAALFSRLDNQVGSIFRPYVWDVILQNLDTETFPGLHQLYQCSYDDWWYRLYDEHWDAALSPSVKRFVGLYPKFADS